MSLDMIGFIDDTFESVLALRTAKTSTFANGRPVNSVAAPKPHTVNVQPLSNKQIQSLDIGAERKNDTRRIWVNDGDLYSILPSDEWTFAGTQAKRMGIEGTFRTLELDNRPWRNYCRVIVSRKDD